MMWITKSHIAHFEIRIGDINYGGHLGNDKALLLFQDARIRFLESLGFSEKYIGDQAGIIMAEAHVYFRKEIFLHDTLTADVSVGEVTNSSFQLIYSIKRTADTVEVLNGMTKLIAFDYERKKVTRLPEVFIQAIRQQ
ncbi:MAG: thioesterase family protein [Bacteroidales bacterium]|nr:thioesterase family protein [Lentimicrobiaceae bacterium]MDD5693837.1 thioesterase family protein [Bacteroidales bacterium]